MPGSVGEYAFYLPRAENIHLVLVTPDGDEAGYELALDVAQALVEELAVEQQRLPPQTFSLGLPATTGCHRRCGSNRPRNPSALAVILVFALAFLFVIPQRSEGICFCSCSTTDRSAPYATVRHSSSEAPLRLAPSG